jgi:hypothetical protein
MQFASLLKLAQRLLSLDFFEISIRYRLKNAANANAFLSIGPCYPPSNGGCQRTGHDIAYKFEPKFTLMKDQCMCDKQHMGIFVTVRSRENSNLQSTSTLRQTYGLNFRRKLITVSEVKRNCMRATDCGKEAWSVNCEPMNKNRIEGTAKQGERAQGRDALVIKAKRCRSGSCTSC